jgi:hypothetical protein
LSLGLPAVNPNLPLLALLAAAAPILAGWRRGGDRDAARARPRRAGWRELGAAWAALGIAGIGLLAPALELPTGIPSPAAALAAVPPWQGSAGGAAGAASGVAVAAGGPGAAAGAERGNPLLRDVTWQVQPWLLFSRRELRAGRLPGWNPHQFAGAPFWANGQSAPLFPLHLLFAALPLRLGFTLLPWLRLVLGGCGVFLLARRLDLGPPAALVSALTFALSGMLVSFVLFPMGNALALVPWVLWAVEGVAGAAGGSAGAAVSLPAAGAGFSLPAAVAAPSLPAAVAVLALAAGLQLLGGHPETSVHTALLSTIYLAVRGAARPAAAWLGWAAGWLGGAALAAVQLLPLALVLPQTARWQAEGAGAEPPFALLLQQPLRLVLPELYGHPARGTWWGPFNYSATAVYAGALALPLAAAGLARCRRDRRWLALGVTAAFAFVAAYHWPGVRDLLAAVPVLGRAAHHRLLFGVELGVALLAGAGCDEWLAGRGRGVLAGGAAVAALLAAAWTLHAGAWTRRGLVATELSWTLAAAVAAAALALSLRLDRAWRARLAPLLPALVLCDLLAAHGAINPGLPLERLYPATGAVRFLAGRPGRVAGVGEALRPNAAMVYCLYDPRGDDPVKLASYEAVYRRLATGDPVYFQPVSRWDSPWLDRLGVRWVLGGGSEAAPAAGWRLAYAGPDARVYERPTALPLLRWAPSAAPPAAVEALAPDRVSPPLVGGADPGPRVPSRPGPQRATPSPPLPSPAGSAPSAAAAVSLPDEGLTLLRREPGRWEVAWRTARQRLLVVAETRERGWQASAAGGRRLPVEAAAGLLLGVRLGPGAGRLELRYRTPGLAAGAAVSCVALLALTAVPLMRRRQRPQLPAAAGAAAIPAEEPSAAAGPTAPGAASPTARGVPGPIARRTGRPSDGAGPGDEAVP